MKRERFLVNSLWLRPRMIGVWLKVVLVLFLVMCVVWWTPCTWSRDVRRVNCQALIEGDEDEQQNAMCLQTLPSANPLSGDDYIRMTENCAVFQTARDYSKAPLSKEEEDFPIAFSIMMYKDIEQAERLLRAIYQPQNFYCIHVDKKAERSIHEGMASIARCFHNVLVIANPIAVVWGEFSVLEQELLCMQELFKYPSWKYFINLTGQEFPLKTNLELVKILTAFNGANSVDGVEGKDTHRWKYSPPAPHGVKVLKGSVHIVVSRGYVDYLLQNQTAAELLDWVKLTLIPDETYFATVDHNPILGVPGSPIVRLQTNEDSNPFINRYKVWDQGILKYLTGSKFCHGKFVRDICIFGIGDLPNLTSLPHLFANKLHWNYHPLAHQCLEEWHHNRTRDRLVLHEHRSLSYYRNLDFVKVRRP